MSADKVKITNSEDHVWVYNSFLNTYKKTNIVNQINFFKLSIQSLNPDELKLSFDFDLPHSIIPDQTQKKFLSTKVSIVK